MSELSLMDSPALPLVLALDAEADAAVQEADALEFARAEDREHEEEDGDGDRSPEDRLEARITPEDGLPARDTTGLTLDQAMDALELENMTAQEVAELESGDAGRMAAVLKMKEAHEMPPLPGSDANVDANADADADADAAGRPQAEVDGSSLNRVSIKALPPALRLKLVTAISRVRDGADFEQALREVFPGAGTAGFEGGAARTEDGRDQSAGGLEARATGAGLGAEAEGGAGQSTGKPEACPTGVAGLQMRLAGMKAEYDRAKSEYDPRAQDLLEAMMDVKLDLREAERTQAGLAQEQRASHERAREEHADLMADKESPFLDLCEMTISLAERNNDPILTLPDWPERIAKQVRGKFFKGGAASSSAARLGSRPESPVPVPPAPHPRVRLPGSPVGNGFAPGSITPETALAEFDQLTPEEQEAALTEIARVTDGRRR